jgi:hypothetical protein
VRSSTATTAGLRFTWLDTTPPGIPQVTSSVVAGQVRVALGAAHEIGSGVAHYDISLDGHAPLSVGRDLTDEPVRIGRPLPGTHTVRVVAIDRAGNHSAPAVRQVHVP